MKATVAFMHTQPITTAPFIQISRAMYACLAKKAATQVKPPTPGFFNDIDFMSCLLPYCDAMFVDRECSTYWREIQNSPTRRLPYTTKVFSLATKAEFLAYLDQLDAAVPAEQRRLAHEVYRIRPDSRLDMTKPAA